MHTYTTCAACGRALNVTPDDPAGYLTHVDCPPATDMVTALRNAYLDAIHREADRATVEDLARRLDEIDEAPRDFRASALLYAAWGWPVFPCRSGLKTPATEHGVKDATTDVEKVKDWWWRWPKANIGIATGYLFDVIDIDPAGYTWLREFGGEDGPLPDIHGKAATPRGVHLYIGPSGKGNLAGFAEGVDYRGRGGYVLAPPSVLGPTAYAGKDTPAGRLIYTWTVYPSPVIKRKSARP